MFSEISDLFIVESNTGETLVPVTTIIMMISAVIIGIVLLNLNSTIFKHLQLHSKKLHLRFFENIIRVFIVSFLFLWAFSQTSMGHRLYQMAFGSTVVLTGVIGIAGKDVLTDVLAGVMLSISRPFEIGDRVLIDGLEKPSVIEDMTLQHVVLRTMDNIRYIIPNSEINSRVITNTSYKQRLRGTFIKIPVAYHTDIRKAISIVRDVIVACPYTFPNNPNNEDLGGYGEVYAMSYDNSAVNLETTIWTEPSMDNFLACSEIRISIMEAFQTNNIEIPYTYTNIIMKDEDPEVVYSDDVVQRNITVKSDLIEVTDYHDQLEDCLAQVRQYCDFHNISKTDRYNVVLLTEELMAFSSNLIKKTKMNFWLEGNRDRIKLVVASAKDFSKKRQLQLIKNATDIPTIQQFITNLKISITNNIEPSGWLFEKTQLKSETTDLEKQLLEAYSDDIKIGVIDKRLTIIVVKELDS